MRNILSNSLRPAACALAALAILALGTYAAYRYWRSHAYDELIAQAALVHDVPAPLIRAVIRRESSFNHRAVGQAGEIGLMQVTEAAAGEWAQAAGHANFTKYELFKPDINVMAGTWYLGRALKRWSHKPNPLPYALAEYNAGRSNALRWAKDDRNDPNIFWHNITFPGTRRYVQDIINDYRNLSGNAAP